MASAPVCNPPARVILADHLLQAIHLVLLSLDQRLLLLELILLMMISF